MIACKHQIQLSLQPGSELEDGGLVDQQRTDAPYRAGGMKEGTATHVGETERRRAETASFGDKGGREQGGCQRVGQISKKCRIMQGLEDRDKKLEFDMVEKRSQWSDTKRKGLSEIMEQGIQL